MAGMGLQGASGVEELQKYLRQRMLDQMAQQEQAQQAQAEQQRIALQSRSLDQSGETNRLMRERLTKQDESEASARETTQALRIGENLSIGQPLNEDTARLMSKVGLNEPPQQGPWSPDVPEGQNRYTGNAQQRNAATQKQILGRMISEVPPGDEFKRERQALQYRQATGDNAPAGMFDPRPPAAGVAARQKAIDEVTMLEQQIKEILEHGDANDWAGTGGLGYGTAARVLKQQIGVGSDMGEALRNKIGTLRTDIAHGKFGSAFTATELKMLNTFAPDIGRDSSANRVNLASLLKEAQRKKAVLSGGKDQPSATSADAPPDATHPPKVVNGWNYEWKGDRYSPVSPATAVAQQQTPQQPAPQSAPSSGIAAPRSGPTLDNTQLPPSGARVPSGEPQGMTQEPIESRPRPTTPQGLPSSPPRLMGRMMMSQQGKQALREREGGFVAEPYPDVNGLAIGYGMHTWKGKPVTAETRATETEANAEMDQQIQQTYGRIVDQALRVPVSQEQYDALVSMSWNLPAAAKRVIAKLNKGEPITAQDFKVSATVGGKPHRGLGKRRESEYSSFIGTP